MGSACSVCEEKAGEITKLQDSKAAAEEQIEKMKMRCQQTEEQAAGKLEDQRRQGDEALERMEEELASYQDQVAELQNRVHELEQAQQDSVAVAAASHQAAAADSVQQQEMMSAKFLELQQALSDSKIKMEAFQKEHEAAVIKMEQDAVSIREEGQKREGKVKEKFKIIAEAAKEKAKGSDTARKAAETETQDLRQKLLAFEHSTQSAASALGVCTFPPTAAGEESAEGSGASQERTRALEDRIRVLEDELGKFQGQLRVADEARKDAEESQKTFEDEMESKREEDKEEMQRMANELKECKKSELRCEEKAKSVVEQAKTISKQMVAVDVCMCVCICMCVYVCV